MNSSNNKQIKINPKDLYNIPLELIINITLKDGSIIILDESVPTQEINKLFNNYINAKENNQQNINRINNKSINLNINNSYIKDNINGKTLEMNDSYAFNQNIINKEILSKSNNNNNNNYNTNNYFYSSNQNNSINNENKNRINNFRSHNQSISDLVTEKFQKKFHSSLKNSNRNKNINTTINSEIKINIQGNNAKKKFTNNLLKDFDELLLNFNDKKKGLNNLNKNNSKKKYKFYKKLICKKNDKLFLDDISGISPNTKAIKYIGRNDQKNITTTTDFINNNNITNINDRLSLLKDKSLKRNKSNNFYLLKNNKIISEIISPPNHLQYNKIFL